MRRNQKGFTLMELMVVIVIVAILAAVAVPLYINYVKDAQRTEAKGAIGAIVTAQQVYFQRSGGTVYAGSLDELKDGAHGKLVDVQEADFNWNFTVTATGGADPGFKVVADGDGSTNEGLKVVYDFLRSTGGSFNASEEK